jgi:type IV pilus assembly protein PilA
MKRRHLCGFTLIELMIVVAIIGIFATMALPSYQDRIIATQVKEGMALAGYAQEAVARQYASNRKFPTNNATAGLPPSQFIVGTYVTDVAVANGAIVVTYGNQSNRNLAGKKLTLRPAHVPDYPMVPISWVCGMAPVPDKMRAQGTNDTSLPAHQLPLDCRPA